MSSRIQKVRDDGVRCEGASVVSGIPQDSLQFPLLILLYTRYLPMILENTSVGYDDDLKTLAVVPKSCNRLQAISSLNRNLDCIVE